MVTRLLRARAASPERAVPAVAAAGTAPRLPARVRIVGGQWRRTVLPVLPVVGLRPTPDRVRETLFNWLGQDLTGWRVLDLFAGTGALGFEAASRGAHEVTVVERHPELLAALEALRKRLDARQVTIEAGDASLVLSRLVQRVAQHHAPAFDLVLLDPPFGSDWAERVRPLLAALLVARGWLYLEADSALERAPAIRQAWQQAGFSLVRAGSAGRVHYHLLQFQSSDRHEDSGLPGNI